MHVVFESGGGFQSGDHRSPHIVILNLLVQPCCDRHHAYLGTANLNRPYVSITDVMEITEIPPVSMKDLRHLRSTRTGGRMFQTSSELSSSRDPWEIAETTFPRQRTKIEKLHFCVNYAALAPSSHNSQPWLFHVLTDQIELYADLRRALPAIDPNHRELVISCGAALHNLVLALRYFGYESSVEVPAKEIAPSEGDHKVLLARVHVGSSTVVSAKERDLFHMIPKRRTSRM